MLVLLTAWTGLWLKGSGDVTPVLLLGAAAIGTVSFADDIWGVRLASRLAVQTVAVATALLSLPSDGPIISGFLPIGLDRIITGLAWLWFVNLFNFMDGIDGIAAGEASVIAVGVIVLAFVRPELDLPALQAVAVGAAAVAFLLFNWPPARVFMGDVGSTGLGFLLGWLLILLAAKGALIPALILPLYFTADATLTLGHRLWRGEPVGQAHRHHAYQRAVDKGLSHSLVSSRVIALGIVLIALAIASTVAPLASFSLGLLLTLYFILWLRSGK